MADAEKLILASDPVAARAAAEVLFVSAARELTSLLPRTAEILHVGATAVPGCLTKGDLDILVRVDPADFSASEAVLARRFVRNGGSARTGEFAAFENPGSTPHLGVQLTVKSGAFDFFHQFAEELRQNPELLRRYNNLKLSFANKSMEDYRAAKDSFVAEVLSGRAIGDP